MAGQIVQINFTFNVSRDEYEQAVAPLADAFAAVPGLQWKVWLMNQSESEAGGIYHFDNEASVTDFLNSELMAQVGQHPALSDFSVKQFEVLEDISVITRGPIKTSE